MWFVFFVELVGGYTVYLNSYEIFEPIKNYLAETPFKRNYWWYALTWNLLGTLLVLNFIKRLLKKERLKSIVKYTMITFTLIAVFLIIWRLDDFFSGFIIALMLLSCFVILFCIALYVMNFLSEDRILEYKKSFSLIVLGALFIWWLVVTPIAFYEDYYNLTDPGYLRLKPLILFFNNILMYGSFSFAFLFCKPQNH